MEACSGAHQWVREFAQFGPTVPLMASKFFIHYRISGRRSCCETVTRPNMCFILVKSLDHKVSYSCTASLRAALARIGS